jgi:hypothetical protein
VWWQNSFCGSSLEQKEFCAEVAQDLLETSNNYPDFLKQVTTGDGSWVYSHDPETKAQSPQRKLHSVSTSKEGAAKSKQHQDHLGFFYHKGVVHHEYAI